MRRQGFEEVADALMGQAQEGERLALWYSGEDSDFIRFNHGQVRQPGSVTQAYITLDLVRDGRRVQHVEGISGHPGADSQALQRVLEQMRKVVGLLPEDPHLMVSEKPVNTIVEEATPFDSERILGTVLSQAEGLDFVGIWASGTIYAGYANSLGQSNWFEKSNFNLDWSLYLQGDKAVKSNLAGFEWDQGRFEAAMADARRTLEVLKLPQRTLEPGAYRAYLAPAALAELMQLLSWGGFGQQAIGTKQSPLQRLADGGAQLNEMVSLTESTKGGAGPGFQVDGFIKRDKVPLVQEGRFAGALVSPRSAKEFGVEHTGATGEESPEALEMAPGDLAADKVGDALGTGLWVNNLWYTNFSDRAQGRVTGMTRFATLWYEEGKPVAPVSVMRFDDTVFDLLGDKLESLTKERSQMLDTGTYDARSTGSMQLPGALVSELNLTL